MDRRSLVKHVGMAGVLAAGMAPAVRAQELMQWRLVTSFPKSLDAIHGAAEKFGQMLKLMSNGQIEVIVQPAGEAMPAFGVMEGVQSGAAEWTEQDESQATKFGRRRPEDGRIDWNKSAVEIYNLVRGVTHPFPGAFAEIEGKKTFIWKARPIEGRAVPGEIVTRKPLTIGTKEGLIEILRLQPEGEPERDA